MKKVLLSAVMTAAMALGGTAAVAAGGDKEVENGEVAVRTRDGVDLGSIKVDKMIEQIQTEINDRSLQLLEE